MKIYKDYTKNYSNRPAGTIIDTIIIHHTGSFNMNGTITWFKMQEYKDPETGEMKKNVVSAHYVIGRKGKIVQMVEENNKARHAGYSYHNGKFRINNNSIGIELVGDGNEEEYTEEQYKSLIWLCVDIMKRRKSVQLDNILSHSYIRDEYNRVTMKNKAKKVDPGEYFKWEWFKQEVKKELEPVIKPKDSKEKEEVKEENPQKKNLFQFISAIIRVLLKFFSKKP